MTEEKPEKQSAQEKQPVPAERIASISEFLKMLNMWVFAHKITPVELNTIAGDMFRQASRQEAMAVLNPSYPMAKNEVIRRQGLALQHMASYIGELMICDDLKKKIGQEEVIRSDIQKLFL